MTVEELAPLMRPADVAARLGMSARRVRTIPAAELPYVQLEPRGQRRYHPEDVARFLERRTVRT
jgi:Helix-turn-helix domain